MMTFALRLIWDELLEKRIKFKRSLVMPQNCSKKAYFSLAKRLHVNLTIVLSHTSKKD